MGINREAKKIHWDLKWTHQHLTLSLSDYKSIFKLIIETYINAHRSNYAFSHSGAQTEDGVCLAYGFDISTLVA